MPIPKLLISLAVSAASMAMTAMRKIEGPRLDDLKFTSGDYGSPLAMVWGKRRIQVPIFWAEDLKEVKQQRKTKGGKYNEYTYYGTFAVALAGHEISGVTRVWFDTHLVFDLTGAGPVTPFDFGNGMQKSQSLIQWREDHPLGDFMPAIGGKGTNYFAFYLGSETQEPDPRIQATVEDAHGEGSCPAYRGTAYMVLKDVPLEKLGNRIPQVSVEVVSDVSGSIPTEQRDYTYAPNTAWNLAFSSDYSRVAWMAHSMSGEGAFEVWDVAARQPMVAADLGAGYGVEITGHFGVYNNGDLLAVNGGGSTLNRITPDGGVSVVQYDPTVNRQQWGCRVVADGAGHEHWGTYPYSFYHRWFFDGVLYEPGYQACLYFADSYGNVWVVGRAVASSAEVYFKRLVTVDNSPGYLEDFVVTMPDVAGPGGSGEGVYACASGENFVCDWEDKLHLIDPVTGTLLSSEAATASGSIYSRKTVWSNVVPGSGRIWRGNSEYDAATGELIRTVGSIPAAGGEFASVYDPISHALWVQEDHITIYYLDRLTGEGALLSKVGEDLAEWVGAQDCDFSAWDALVNWSMTQGQASNGLEPLLDANDCDIAPRDFANVGTKRTGISTGTLETARFAKDSGARYTLRVRQASELPKALVYNFADTGADQQPNNVRVSRPLDATDASDERTIDLTTLADDPDTMRGKADRHFRRLWNSRKEASFALTFQSLAIAPTDVKTPHFDDESFTARCIKTVIRANGVMATEWTYDHPSLATMDNALGANFDGRNPSAIVISGIAKGFVLDVPLLRDADNDANPQVYIAASGYNASIGFAGAVVFQAVDGDYSEQIGGIDSTSPATWGYTTTLLPDGNPNVWDRGSTVNVILQYGTLTGVTEAAIDANPLANLALIGDEIVNFTTATLEGDGTYTLSGFKRGRRGTEWATDAHGTRDVVLLLNMASPEAMGLSEVSTNLSFKAVTNGKAVESAFPIEMEPYTGATLKPYAPCHLTSELVSGDWVMGWTRRTRVGGAWTGGSAIPLSEASEEYEVDIMNGTSVVRTITGLSSPTATWTAAMQTTDFGGAQEGVRFQVYQISDAVGRGFVGKQGLPFSTIWRVDHPVGASGVIEYFEIQMAAEAGGVDQCVGGTPSASSEYSGLYPATKAFDDDFFAGIWAHAAGAGVGSWIQYEFPTSVTVNELRIKCSGGGNGPPQLRLRYWDGFQWVTYFDHSGLSWDHNATKTFNA